MFERQITDSVHRINEHKLNAQVLEKLLQSEQSSIATDQNYLFDIIKGKLLSDTLRDSFFDHYINQKWTDYREKDVELVSKIIGSIPEFGVNNLVYLAIVLQTALTEGECEWLICSDYDKGAQIDKNLISPLHEFFKEFRLETQLIGNHDKGFLLSVQKSAS